MSVGLATDRSFHPEVLRAWDFTPERSIDLYLLTLVPNQFTRLGRNPLRRFDHQMVPRPFGRANPLAVLPSFALGCLSGLCHPVHRPQPCSDCADSRERQLPSDWKIALGCKPRTPPLPLPARPIGVAARCAVLQYGTWLDCCLVLIHMQASLANILLSSPQLASLPAPWRTDLTSDSAFLPVPDSQSPHDESC